MTVFITKTLYILPKIIKAIALEIIREYDFQTSLFPIFSLLKQDKNSQKLTLWNLRRGEENLLHKAN